MAEDTARVRAVVALARWVAEDRGRVKVTDLHWAIAQDLLDRVEARGVRLVLADDEPDPGPPPLPRLQAVAVEAVLEKAARTEGFLWHY